MLVQWASMEADIWVWFLSCGSCTLIWMKAGKQRRADHTTLMFAWLSQAWHIPADHHAVPGAKISLQVQDMQAHANSPLLCLFSRPQTSHNKSLQHNHDIYCRQKQLRPDQNFRIVSPSNLRPMTTWYRQQHTNQVNQHQCRAIV